MCVCMYQSMSVYVCLLLLAVCSIISVEAKVSKHRQQAATSLDKHNPAAPDACDITS